MSLRASCTCGVSVRTTMPSAATSVHAVCSLGTFLDFDQAHAAGGLQRQAGVVAERRNFDAEAARRFDDQRSRRDGERRGRQSST